MGVPVWVVVLALGFWGAWAGALGIAFPLVVLVVAPGVVRRRFDLTGTEFHRALDVCWVLLVGGVMLAYSREPMGGVLRSFARWLPVVVYPAVMAQVWSVGGRVPVGALIPLPGWRRQVDPGLAFDVRPVFVAVCLLAAGVAEGGRPWYYGGVLAVAGAAFWSVRVRGIRVASVVVLLGMAAVGGWYVAGAIGGVQQWVETRVFSLVTRLRGDDASRRMFRTAIGRTGEVGGGSEVVLQVRGFGQGPIPRLLRTSVFTTWHEGMWFAPRGPAEKVEAVGEEWRLDRRPGREGAAYIEWVPERTGRYLPLPSATRVIADLVATRMERTGVGTVRAEMGGGVVTYRVDFGPDSDWEAVPRKEDVESIATAELPAIRAITEAWGLAGEEPAEVVRRIETRFQREYRYTTRLEDRDVPDIRAQTALGRFLIGSKAGHCEYFATAAVLLLRNAGVAARYVTGYSVGAGERRGDLVTVRQAQAHAWVRVWLGGGWRDFDPTPSGSLEEGGVGPRTLGERFWRGWDDLRFALSRWWWLGEKRWLRQAYWLAVPLLAGLLWRLRRVREAVPAGAAEQGPGEPVPWPGEDSEWFGLAAWLARDGWLRRGPEPEAAWWARLEEGGWPAVVVGRVAVVYALHQRLRFDPRGLDVGERERLRREARELLQWVERRDGVSGVATRA